MVGCGGGLRAGALVGKARHGWRRAGERARGANGCNSVQDQVAFSCSLDDPQLGTPCDVVQSSTTQCVKAGEGDRTLDIQLGKLTLYH